MEYSRFNENLQRLAHAITGESLAFDGLVGPQTIGVINQALGSIGKSYAYFEGKPEQLMNELRDLAIVRTQEFARRYDGNGEALSQAEMARMQIGFNQSGQFGDLVEFSMPVDGLDGPITRSGFKDFKREFGLEPRPEATAEEVEAEVENAAAPPAVPTRDNPEYRDYIVKPGEGLTHIVRNYNREHGLEGDEALTIEDIKQSVTMQVTETGQVREVDLEANPNGLFANATIRLPAMSPAVMEARAAEEAAREEEQARAREDVARHDEALGDAEARRVAAEEARAEQALADAEPEGSPIPDGLRSPGVNPDVAVDLHDPVVGPQPEQAVRDYDLATREGRRDALDTPAGRHQLVERLEVLASSEAAVMDNGFEGRLDKGRKRDAIHREIETLEADMAGHSSLSHTHRMMLNEAIAGVRNAYQGERVDSDGHPSLYDKVNTIVAEETAARQHIAATLPENPAEAAEFLTQLAQTQGDMDYWNNKTDGQARDIARDYADAARERFGDDQQVINAAMQVESAYAGERVNVTGERRASFTDHFKAALGKAGVPEDMLARIGVLGQPDTAGASPEAAATEQIAAECSEIEGGEGMTSGETVGTPVTPQQASGNAAGCSRT